MLVRVLLIKVMGQPFCTRMVPKSYSLALVCTMTGFVLSKYLRVVFSSMEHIQVLEGCIGQGIPISFGKLLMEEHGFVGEAGNERLDVVDQA